MDAVQPPSFEREKWAAEHRLREREIAVKEDEARIRSREIERSRWANPLVLAILAAALAATGNAIVAYISSRSQLELERYKSDAQIALERSKTEGEQRLDEARAEAARILEVTRTNDPDKAATNLKFLLDAGLISNPTHRERLTAYLGGREPGQGVALPGESQTNAAVVEEIEQLKGILQSYEGEILFRCSLPGATDRSLVSTTVGEALREDRFAILMQSSTRILASKQLGRRLRADPSYIMLRVSFERVPDGISVTGAIVVPREPTGNASLTYFTAPIVALLAGLKPVFSGAECELADDGAEAATSPAEPP